MQEHLSPEERLLKLIRKKEKVPVKDSLEKKQSGPPGGNITKDVSKIFDAFEKFFVTVSLLLIAYIVYGFFFTGKDIGGMDHIEESAVQLNEKDTVQDSATVKEPKTYTYYAQAAQERDLFESPMFKKTAEAKGASLSEFTKNLRLVGIILDNLAEAVIEDTEAQQTFFLHKGDKIRDAVVDDIQEGKVILLLGDQKIELIQ